RYILTVNTNSVNIKEKFSIIVYGPNNVFFSRINNSNDTSLITEAIYSSVLATQSQKDKIDDKCIPYSLRETIQIKVITSAFNRPRTILSADFSEYFKFVVNLVSNTTYILSVSTASLHGVNFSIISVGPSNVSFKSIVYDSTIIESTYSSELTTSSQRYFRDCGIEKHYYETINITVKHTGNYSFYGISTIRIYGYIYRNNFNPFNPKENLLTENGITCDEYKFSFAAYLDVNITYIFVVTTLVSNMQGNFSFLVTGQNDVIMNRTIQNYGTCSVGHWCYSYTRTIGWTLDDILRQAIVSNATSY
ncbi:hypothetical protein I4U23_016694, partial [Adineta vaga]